MCFSSVIPCHVLPLDASGAVGMSGSIFPFRAVRILRVASDAIVEPPSSPPRSQLFREIQRASGSSGFTNFRPFHHKFLQLSERTCEKCRPIQRYFLVRRPEIADTTKRQASRRQSGKPQMRKRSGSGPTSCTWIACASAVGLSMTGWRPRRSFSCGEATVKNSL
jgi:hypothetical protein